MKKRLLILSLMVMLVLTGCGKDTKGYEEKVYTPVKENVEKLNELMGDYLTRTEGMRTDNQNTEETTLKGFFEDIEKLEKDMSEIKPLDSFKDEEKKEFEEMMSDFKKATENIYETGGDLISLYVMGSSNRRIEEYEKLSNDSNDFIDSFLEKFNSLNKEYEIKDEIKIENRTIEYKPKDIETMPLNAKQEPLMQAYLEGVNESKDQGVSAEFDNDNRTFYVVFRDDITISNPEIIKKSAQSTSNIIENSIAGRVTVKVVYDNDRENPLLVILQGLIIEDNMQ